MGHPSKLNHQPGWTNVCAVFRSVADRDAWAAENPGIRAVCVFEPSMGTRFDEVRVMFTPETEQERDALATDWQTRVRPGGKWVSFDENGG